MKILNLGCNGHRPKEPFINVDILRTQFVVGSQELTTLNSESNYIECDLVKNLPLPFSDSSCDGVFISHFIEHLDVPESVNLIKDSLRVLIPNGLLVISVPNTSYFRKVYDRDCKENDMELFGETLNVWNMSNGDIVKFDKFFDYALFYFEHKQILTEDSLWALMTKAGCKNICSNPHLDSDIFRSMDKELNRRNFSSILWAVK
jgi:predicted SAM-dependent methyltransferase